MTDKNKAIIEKLEAKADELENIIENLKYQLESVKTAIKIMREE